MKKFLDALWDLVKILNAFVTESLVTSLIYWFVFNFVVGFSFPFLKVWGLYMVAKITLNKLSEYLP